MDSHKIVKEEMDAANNSYDYCMDVKAEDHPIQIETNIDLHMSVKQEMDAVNNYHNDYMDVKVEYHSIQNELKQESEPCTTQSNFFLNPIISYTTHMIYLDHILIARIVIIQLQI